MIVPDRFLPSSDFEWSGIIFTHKFSNVYALRYGEHHICLSLFQKSINNQIFIQKTQPLLQSPKIPKNGCQMLKKNVTGEIK